MSKHTLPKSNILDILYIRADFSALGDCLKLINSNLRNEEGGRILHCDGGLKFCAQLVFLNWYVLSYKLLCYRLIHRSVDRWVLGHIYNMKNQLCAGLGSRASTVKKIGGQLWATFEGGFFMFCGAKKNIFFKYCSVRTKKLHKMKVRQPKKIFKI